MSNAKNKQNPNSNKNLANGGAVERPQARARGHKGGGKSKSHPRKSRSSPNGLGLLIHNSYKKNKRLNEVYLGLIDLKVIESDFKAMLGKVNGHWLWFRDAKKDEVFSVPNGSRHNKESRYFYKARKRILKEVKAFRNMKMLTLTFDPEKAELDIPLWWSLGDKDDPPSYLRCFLVVFGSRYLKKFLDRLKLWRRRSGQRWNYLAYVMEIQPKTGHVHYHLLFFGKWIAPIDVLKRFWDGSDQDAGVDVSKGDSPKKAVSYITKYVTKMNDLAHDSKWADLHMVMWYFKVRSFNTRHVNRHDDVLVGPQSKYDGFGLPRYCFVPPQDYDKYKDIGRFYETEREWKAASEAQTGGVDALYSDGSPVLLSDFKRWSNEEQLGKRYKAKWKKVSEKKFSGPLINESSGGAANGKA